MKTKIMALLCICLLTALGAQAEDIIVDDFSTDTMTTQTRFRNSYVDTGWIKQSNSDWTIAGGALTNAGTTQATIGSEGGVGQVVSTSGLTAGNTQIEVSFDYTVAAGATLYYHLIGLTTNVAPAATEILGNTGTIGGNIQATKSEVDFANMDLITGGEVADTSTLTFTGSGSYSVTIGLTGYTWDAAEAVVGGNAITDVKDFEMIFAAFSSDLTTNGAAMTIDNYSVTATSPTNSAIGIAPAALSLILVDPDTSTNGVLNARFSTGSASNDVEIISTLTDVADFTAVASGTTLNAGNPAEIITVTYTNSAGDLVNNGDATNATLSVEWTAVGSGVTNITEVPLDVVYSKFTLAGLATDRSMSTPNDRLRVAFQHAGADSIELAVLNAADAKLDFTAYDEHAANTVRAIYTTKTGVPSAVTNQATDFTDSSFFSYISEPFAVNIPVDNSGEASNVVELVDLVNNAWTWKDDVDETVVFIDLASISEISNLVSDVDLTIEVTAKSGASTLVSEIDVTITPDGTVSYTFVANGASYAETNGIEMGSNEGGSGNKFTGTNRHLLLSAGSDQDQVATATGVVNDKALGMFFDTGSSGFLLDNILINLSTDNAPVIPAGALLKLELWKINADLGALSTTNVATTFPNPELVFTGTGVFPGTYNDDDLYKIDLPGITLDAETRYGWSLRWNTTEPASLIIGVDRGPTDTEGSFDGGNHLRLNRSNDMFPFYGVTDDESAGAWDIVFFLRSEDPNTFEVWIGGFGLSGDDLLPKTDVEGDGLDNLMEYALGGNPTNDDAAVVSPATYVADDGGTDYFYHVSDQRADDAALTFTLGTEIALTGTPVWDTNDVSFVGESTVSNYYKTVTNRTEASSNAKFIQLKVEK